MIHSLVKELALEPFWLVGCSYGAQVALDYTLAYPQMVRGLALTSFFPGGYRPKGESARAVQEEQRLLEAGEIEAAVELNLRTWLDGPRRSPVQTNTRLRSFVKEMLEESFRLPEPENASIKPLDPPALVRLREIAVPVQVHCGLYDLPEFIQVAGDLTAHISHASLEKYQKTGHLVCMEQPERFNWLLEEFIENQGQQDE
jgi:pimeloyl-ACP methyl ester carboxylesterase